MSAENWTVQTKKQGSCPVFCLTFLVRSEVNGALFDECFDLG